MTLQGVRITNVHKLLADVARWQPSIVLSFETPSVAEENKTPRLMDTHPQLRQRIQIFWDTEDPAVVKSPSLHDMGTALTFLKKSRSMPLINGGEGLSRASAMGLAFLVAANPGVSVQKCIDHLKARHDVIFSPNLLMIAHADHILHQKGGLKDKGALLNAVATDGDFARARAYAAEFRQMHADKISRNPSAGRQYNKHLGLDFAQLIAN